MKAYFVLPFVALTGCSSTAFDGKFSGWLDPEPAASETPQAAVVAPPPPATATSIEEFDTTSQADRDAAVTTVAMADAALGTTIASLGSPADPGIWLKTPLVTTPTVGRVAYQGTVITIELRPSGGAVGSGSQISLAAMRLLNAPLTGLPELTVFAAA